MGILNLITTIKQSRSQASQLTFSTNPLNLPQYPSQSSLPGPSRLYYEPPRQYNLTPEANVNLSNTRQYYEQFAADSQSSNDSQSSYASSGYTDIDFAKI